MADDAITKKPKSDDTKGVVPGGRLDVALRTLNRPERRALLASITSRNPTKRGRLERQLEKRLKELRIEL